MKFLPKLEGPPYRYIFFYSVFLSASLYVCLSLCLSICLYVNLTVLGIRVLGYVVQAFGDWGIVGIKDFAILGQRDCWINAIFFGD